MSRRFGGSAAIFALLGMATVYACGGDDSTATSGDAGQGNDATTNDVSTEDVVTPRDAAPADSGHDAAPPVCDAGLVCGDNCVPVDVLHCGACNYACFSGQTCGFPNELDAGAAGDASDAGDAGDAGAVDAITCLGPEPPASRALAPLSGSQTTTRKPTFTWKQATGITTSHVQVCSDRACAHVIDDLSGSAPDASGTTSATPASDLPAGGLFWRVLGNLGAHDTAPSPIWTLFIPMTSAPHASSAKLTRDVNADGLGDIVLTDNSALFEFPLPDGGMESTGGGYGALYYGRSPSPSASPTPVLVPDQADFFYAGDFDGDGFADLEAAGGSFASFFFGDVTAPSISRSSRISLGSAYANGMGDTDGDGYDDFEFTSSPLNFVAGGPRLSEYFPPFGHFFNPSAFQGFGQVVVPCNDLNGDGYADIATSAWQDTGLAPYGGTVYVLYGSPSGPNTSVYATLVGSGDQNGIFGAAIASGDIDGDGYEDLIVGAPWEGHYTGSVYVFRGGPAGVAVSPAWTIHGSADGGVNARPGHALAVADFDGDGFDDIATTAGPYTGSISGATTTDRVLVFRGTATGPSTTPDLVISSPDGSAVEFGRFLATPLDATGDGYSDLVIGEGTTTTAYFHAGSSTGLPASYTVKLNGPSPNAWTSIAY